MRPPFFNSPERIEALRVEARTWAGTPFRQGCRVKGKGGGVDCIGFALACYEASGFAPPGRVTLPEYELEHYEHSDVSLLEEWFRGPDVRRSMERVDDDSPTLPGDLCFIRYRRAVHHVGVWIDGMVWHTMRTQYVMPMRIENIARLGGELRTRFRPIET